MPTSPSSDLALRVLRIEQQLDSYQRLHWEELDALRRELSEMKEQVLSLATANFAVEPEDAPGLVASVT
jgi:hypothetical protein